MDIIGQKNLIAMLHQYVQEDKFPRFSILVGPEGSGKKTMCKYIVNLFKAVHYLSGIGVADVRDTINYMYQAQSRTVYTFYDVDYMSVQSKNALLKVAEECPNNAYIIMTVSNLDTVLDTIKSRASVFHLEPYSPDEILKYAQRDGVEAANAQVIQDLCQTPGDVDLLRMNGVQELWQYAVKAVDNIAQVSGANAFKIADKISLKKTDDKYDMMLFLKAFRQICLQRALSTEYVQDKSKYISGVVITNKTINNLSITGINKSALFDIFILDIRKEWM